MKTVVIVIIIIVIVACICCVSSAIAGIIYLSQEKEEPVQIAPLPSQQVDLADIPADGDIIIIDEEPTPKDTQPTQTQPTGTSTTSYVPPPATTNVPSPAPTNVNDVEPQPAEPVQDSTYVEQKVIVYDKRDFQGELGQFGVGDYKLTGKLRNDIASLKIPQGLKVTLYDHGDFTSDLGTYEGDVAKLPSGARNDASALKVFEGFW